jgi:hypothetical protein
MRYTMLRCERSGVIAARRKEWWRLVGELEKRAAAAVLIGTVS